MAEVVLALDYIELSGGFFKRWVLLAIWGRAFVLVRTNGTVIGTRPAHFRYRSWKEACHATETL
ncbi:hypothetical protein G6L68_07690 [Agrobacterium fabrum]|nr:hypothetical protein [Agrobacterium fabrum]